MKNLKQIIRKNLLEQQYYYFDEDNIEDEGISYFMQKPNRFERNLPPIFSKLFPTVPEKILSKLISVLYDIYAHQEKFTRPVDFGNLLNGNNLDRMRFPLFENYLNQMISGIMKKYPEEKMRYFENGKLNDNGEKMIDILKTKIKRMADESIR